MIVMLSSVGLPGLNGFVGEFLILLGSFKSVALGSPWYAIAGASGVIFAAVYLLWSYQRVFFGTVTSEANASLKDMSAREWVVMVPVMFFIVWIGWHPSTFMDKTAVSCRQVLLRVETARHGLPKSLPMPQVGQQPGTR